MIQVGLIVAAGGQSTRFRRGVSDARDSGKQKSNCIPESDLGSKLFSDLNGKTILQHVLESFSSYPQIREMVLTAPKGNIPEVRAILHRSRLKFPVHIVEGGSTRAQSVLNGLSGFRGKYDWVMVHDGARPLISEIAIRELFSAAETGRVDAVLLGRKVVPTLKHADALGSVIRTVDRSALWEAETPQLIRKRFLMTAYQSLKEAFQATDESMLVEALGGKIQIVNNESWNPKITTYHDLKLVRAYLNRDDRVEFRTGMGKDFHRLVPKRPLWLGGIQIPSNLGALGHSDGDALLHAISDAILGGIGEGDIGDWFSDKDPQWKGMPSSKILKFSNEKANKRKWFVSYVDTIIHLESPKLGPYKSKIKNNIAALLGIKSDQVSVKAKTMEGAGDIGQKRAISADAVVTLKRVAL